jgi:membrane-anchored protein YejM (alkaline phosphatase superfamily)
MNDSVTMTAPGHASILTGTWQNIENYGAQHPTQPTIFEYFRKQHTADSTTCWVVLGKSKLNVLSGSTHPKYGQKYSASVKYSGNENSDFIALDNARYVLHNYHPRLTAINFPMLDYKGHGGDWNAYLSTIQEIDSLIASLWDVIQEDPLLQNKTTLVVTNDHGRHTYDFTNHGDGCEGCRHIMLLIIGPDTPAGIVDSMPHAQVDIAPTIGALMKFTTLHSTGSVIQSAVVLDR